MWSEYERLFLQVDATSSGFKGLKCRWLLRDLDDADAGFSISLWESAEELDRYRAAIRDVRENQSRALFVNEYTRYECEVRVVSAGALGHMQPPPQELQPPSPDGSKSSGHIDEAGPR
jgi:heme-degrading monooxygenase HmoA